eukprot:465916-Hanusia_phi.AAC.1
MQNHKLQTSLTSKTEELERLHGALRSKEEENEKLSEQVGSDESILDGQLEGSKLDDRGVCGMRCECWDEDIECSDRSLKRRVQELENSVKKAGNDQKMWKEEEEKRKGEQEKILKALREEKSVLEKRAAELGRNVEQ